MKSTILFFGIIVFVLVGFFFYRQSNKFDLPQGKTVLVEESEGVDLSGASGSETDAPSESDEPNDTIIGADTNEKMSKIKRTSKRDVFLTDGVRHSIPLGEILSGGVGKDGIPSIDAPKFVFADDADEFLKDDSIGLGILHKGEARFYPYAILVWHEIVNDISEEDPILVTYCPLCATGVVFNPNVSGTVYEFGVSGNLWRSNLLMYNRAADSDDESLWSQVLGEAVLGEFTGVKLDIVQSDTVRYGDWKDENPETKVLSQDTGALRNYGRDPYGSYYTDESVSFGATFNDKRLHPKAFVLGIEIGDQFKAYHKDALPEGVTLDTFAGVEIKLEKSEIGGVVITSNGSSIPYIGGFWFSWLAVHPETGLYK